MTEPVNLEIAKLLKEKGFDLPTKGFYYSEEFKTEDIKFSDNINHNSHISKFSSPTIVEAVMWLYEKHGIWITVLKHRNESKEGFVAYNNDKVIDDKIFFKLHSSPTEVYLSAITYILTKLT